MRDLRAVRAGNENLHEEFSQITQQFANNASDNSMEQQALLG